MARVSEVTNPTPTQPVTVGVGAGGLATADMVLNIGPQHPATHGVLRLRIVIDGERIVSADPVIGYMHRGAEKLFEVRDYRQIVVLANRHDWLSAFGNELGVVLGVEAMLGMEVPIRAVWTRMLLAELNRVLSHLMFLGSYPLELGAITPVFYAFREREEIQTVLEEASGGRMHYMFNRVGGLKEDLPLGWLDRVGAAVAGVRRRIPDLESLLVGNEILIARTRGVGVLSAQTARAYGVSGAIARASGVDVDLRRDAPYLAYAELFAPGGPGRVPLRTAGDGLARLEVLMEQTRVGLDLADACLDRLRTLPPGPVSVKLPKVVKVPEGDLYTATENPLGFNGYWLVSRGEKTPHRLKLRSASFNNVAVLREMLPGCLVSDMVSILGSMFFVVGDVDK
ncbi:MAG: NADH-quinone oxidoreductase subunit D [Dermatophilaceae bacterium]